MVPSRRLLVVIRLLAKSMMLRDNLGAFTGNGRNDVSYSRQRIFISMQPSYYLEHGGLVGRTSGHENSGLMLQNGFIQA
jgi:hypothetical protein